MENKKNKKKSFIQISKSILKEIRKRYEFGESLKELAYEYRVNYGTLKNYSSKEKWEKGINAGVIYLREIEQDIEHHLEEREKIKKVYQAIHRSNLNYMLELEKKGDHPKNDKAEMALKNRVAAIRESYDLAKELYGIMNKSEELDYKSKLMQYENYKQNLLGGGGNNLKEINENPGIEDMTNQELDNLSKKYLGGDK